MKLSYLALRHGRNRILALLMIFVIPLLAMGCASSGKCMKHDRGSGCATCCKGSCDQCCKGDCKSCADCSAGKCC